MFEGLFIVITIAPIIASNKMSDVMMNSIKRLVYNMLPIEVMCEDTVNMESQDLLLTLATAIAEK